MKPILTLCALLTLGLAALAPAQANPPSLVSEMKVIETFVGKFRVVSLTADEETISVPADQIPAITSAFTLDQSFLQVDLSLPGEEGKMSLRLLVGFDDDAKEYNGVILGGRDGYGNLDKAAKVEVGSGRIVLTFPPEKDDEGENTELRAVLERRGDKLIATLENKEDGKWTVVLSLEAEKA